MCLFVYPYSQQHYSQHLKCGRNSVIHWGNEWISKMWYMYVCVYIHIYTMDHYSALKRKEILTNIMTWMNTEDVLLSEISQTWRTNTAWFTYTNGIIWNSQVHRDTKGMVGVRGCGESKWGVTVRQEESFGLAGWKEPGGRTVVMDA